MNDSNEITLDVNPADNFQMTAMNHNHTNTNTNTKILTSMTMSINPAEICQMPATMQTGETVRQADTPNAIATEVGRKELLTSFEKY